MTETADRWRRVEAICQSALDHPPSERAAYLLTACGGDVELRGEVERLLAQEPTAERFLAGSISAAAAGTFFVSGQLLSGHVFNGLEVHELLGAGGMGEVYRARDTKLKRDAAIKVLPPHLARDPEQMARFQREAEVLASLNHPYIAQVYGLESSDDVLALVMELVEGPTLGDRIVEHALPVDEALHIAQQIAEALEAAHAQGIVHRDIKPANIKVRTDGTVKILDFGLAKFHWLVDDGPRQSLHPPSLKPEASLTKTGLVLGTAAYMAPEQARGRPVDKRADIWAFGCVLFEMLSGRVCFSGDSVDEVIDSILNREPDLAGLVKTPESVRQLLRKCLQKEPRRRLRDIGDAQFELEAGRHELSDVQVKRAFVPPSFALTIVPPPGVNLPHVADQAGVPQISPDGTHVLCGPLMRRIESLEPRVFDVPAWGEPFWSQDSMSVVCPCRSELRSVRVSDNHVEVLAVLTEPMLGGACSARGTILLSTGRTLRHLPAGGGPFSDVLHRGVQGTILSIGFVGDTEHFLFWNGDESRGGRVFLAAVQNTRHKTVAPDGHVYWFSETVECTPLLDNETGARYTAAGGGGILFVQNDDLHFQRLNLQKRRLEGEPQIIQRGVASAPQFALGAFSVSLNGVVAWRPGSRATARLTTFNRQGDVTGVTGPPGVFLSLRLSPDESRILIQSERAGTHVVEPNRPGSMTLGPDRWIVWSQDGTELIGTSGATRRLVRRQATGLGGIQFVESGDASIGRLLEDVSPDGTTLLFTSSDGVVFSSNAFAAVVATGEPQTKSDAECPRFSPDGRWIIYSEQGGGIFVQRFPGGPGLRKQIADHGQYPVWRRDGNEIVFLEAKQIWSIGVTDRFFDLDFAPAVPLAFVGDCPGLVRRLNPLAITKDGSRVFFPRVHDAIDSNVIHVAAGWGSDLEAKDS